MTPWQRTSISGRPHNHGAMMGWLLVHWWGVEQVVTVFAPPTGYVQTGTEIRTAYVEYDDRHNAVITAGV